MKVKLEYRGTTAETYGFTDRESGKKIEGQKVVHNFESETGEVIRVNDPEAATLNLTHYASPFKKGQVYAVDISFDAAKPVKAKSIQALEEKGK